MTRSRLEPKSSQSGSAGGTSAVQARTTSGREPQVDLIRAAAGESTSTQTRPPDTASSRPGYTRTGTITAEQMKQAEHEWSDRQNTTTSCFFCDWTHEGPAGEGRAAALTHRQVEHPEACIRKPRKTKRMTKKTIRTAGEEEQIKVDAAEANRVRAEREQAEMLEKIERGRARERAVLAALDVAAADV